MYGGGFVYPPIGALLFLPAAFMPWPVFAVSWVTTLGFAACWLLWPLPLRLRIPIFIALASTFAWGNAATLLAVVLVLAPRWPVVWSLLAWTKVTPAVAALALVRRRRWGSLASVGAAVALPGLALSIARPDLVSAWLAQLAAHGEIPSYWLVVLPWVPPFAVRVAAAAAIAWFGASRPWAIVVAATVATPDLSLSTCGLLAALPRLVRSPRPARAEAAVRSFMPLRAGIPHLWPGHRPGVETRTIRAPQSAPIPPAEGVR